jgi:hypothetical protein
VIDRRGFSRDLYRKGVIEIGTTVADILNYLDRREEVTQCVSRLVRKVVAAAPGKVVFVGESLGGVMLVDALAEVLEKDHALRERASLLITFASQSAALAAIASGGVQEVSRPPFTPWVNIWHRDDFLSYPIVGTYKSRGIRDYEARHRSVFPEVHSEYVTNPASRLFDYINRELAPLLT